ncbi:MAG: fructosamine kinase family protein [Candidatus Fimenecus sp.]
MEQRRVKPYSKDDAMKYAKSVLQNKMDCKVKSISYIGGGSYGYVYICEIDKSPYKLIMKACRVDGMCEQEAHAITLLGEDSLIPMPKVLFISLSNEEIPLDFICEEFVEGKNCLSPALTIFSSKKAKQEFADKITDAMGFWHSKTNDKFGLIDNAVFDTWLDYYKPFAFEILETARDFCNRNKLDKDILLVMEKAWDNFDYIFSEPVENAVLIHGDLNTMNIMADKHLNPTAIIDPLESKWADREYDLFQLRNLNGEMFHLYETYKRKFPVSEKCDIKCAFYGLYNEIYCNIMAGSFNQFLIKPVVKRMKKELTKAVGGYKELNI